VAQVAPVEIDLAKLFAVETSAKVCAFRLVPVARAPLDGYDCRSGAAGISRQGSHGETEGLDSDRVPAHLRGVREGAN
jgi:hypothetical protein